MRLADVGAAASSAAVAVAMAGRPRSAGAGRRPPAAQARGASPYEEEGETSFDQARGVGECCDVARGFQGQV